MKTEKMELDHSKLKYLYYLDKGIETSIILCEYHDKYIIGKLYSKAEL